jgi:dienelactone hydrolase
MDKLFCARYTDLWVNWLAGRAQYSASRPRNQMNLIFCTIGERSAMGYEEAYSDFEQFEFTEAPYARPVFRKGAGPAVIIIHEMPGLHPMVLDFARTVSAAGMTTFCPSLFGHPGKPVSRGYVVTESLITLCIRREFNAWAADRSSPIVDWLRALARRVHKECGGKGVGAIGMCFTGGFALVMMTEPAVTAPVLSQPSLPLGRTKREAIGVSPSEISCARDRFAAEGLSMIGLRFKGDPFVPDERFDRYTREFGDTFERLDIDPADAKSYPGVKHPHSVLTLNLNEEGATKAALQRVVEFLRMRTGAA